MSQQNLFDQTTPAKTQTKTDKRAEITANTLEIDPGDSETYTPQSIKQSLQELLKHGLLYSDSKPKLYRQALANSTAINAFLSALDLKLVIDEVRGLAFLTVADAVRTGDYNEAGVQDTTTDNSLSEDDWSHPLVRRQRLNMEQSLLLAILRQFYVTHEQDAGIGSAPAVMTVDEVQASLNLFLGDSGSDTKDEKRALALLEKLKGHGIVSEVDAQLQFTIRPIITHVANPATLTALLEHYRQQALANPDNTAD